MTLFKRGLVTKSYINPKRNTGVLHSCSLPPPCSSRSHGGGHHRPHGELSLPTRPPPSTPPKLQTLGGLLPDSLRRLPARLRPARHGLPQVSLAKRLMAPPRRDASNARPASHRGPPPTARPPPRASSCAGAASAMPPRAPRPSSQRGAATRGRRACATTMKPVRWAASRTRQATCGSLHSEGLFACSDHGV